MTSWTVDNPATFDFDEVTDLKVRLIGGECAGAESGNVGGMSGNVSVTCASGAITPLRRERVGSETR